MKVKLFLESCNRRQFFNDRDYLSVWGLNFNTDASGNYGMVS